MSTIKDSPYFSYAGRKSTDFSISNVVVGSGSLEEVFAPSREIKEVSVKGRDRPYFQSTEKTPLQFSVSFWFDDPWDDSQIREMARWLTEQNYYQPLYFSHGENDNPERIFYALVVGDSTLIHNGAKQGYVNLTFRCDGAYGYSPVQMSKIYNWTGQNRNINFTNLISGNFYNTQMNNFNQVILSLQNKTWLDYPQTQTWLDSD